MPPLERVRPAFAIQLRQPGKTGLVKGGGHTVCTTVLIFPCMPVQLLKLVRNALNVTDVTRLIEMLLDM